MEKLHANLPIAHVNNWLRHGIKDRGAVCSSADLLVPQPAFGEALYDWLSRWQRHPPHPEWQGSTNGSAAWRKPLPLGPPVGMSFNGEPSIERAKVGFIQDFATKVSQVFAKA